MGSSRCKGCRFWEYGPFWRSYTNEKKHVWHCEHERVSKFYPCRGRWYKPREGTV